MDDTRMVENWAPSDPETMIQSASVLTAAPPGIDMFYSLLEGIVMVSYTDRTRRVPINMKESLMKAASGAQGLDAIVWNQDYIEYVKDIGEYGAIQPRLIEGLGWVFTPENID